MDIKDFEIELKTINKDLSIRPNVAPQRVVDMFPDVLKLASVLYCGEEVCTMPNYDIYDEPNASYGVDLRQDGTFKRHRTRPEVLDIVKTKLEQLKTKDNADAFFGRGEYSEAALRSNQPYAEVITEIPIELKEIKGGDPQLEGGK